LSKSVQQIKFTIDSDIVSSFRARCALAGVSMASVISQLMKTCQPTKAAEIKIDTRPHRKKAALEYIGSLEDLLQAEEQYRDAIPEQFELRYETADHSCEQLAQAISILEDAY